MLGAEGIAGQKYAPSETCGAREGSHPEAMLYKVSAAITFYLLKQIFNICG